MDEDETGNLLQLCRHLINEDFKDISAPTSNITLYSSGKANFNRFYTSISDIELLVKKKQQQQHFDPVPVPVVTYILKNLSGLDNGPVCSRH